MHSPDFFVRLQLYANPEIEVFFKKNKIIVFLLMMAFVFLRCGAKGQNQMNVTKQKQAYSQGQ